MKRLIHYIKPYKLAFILGPLLMIVEVIGEILMPKLMANIINVGITGKSTGYVITMGALMVLMAVLMMAGGTGGAWFAAKGSVSMATDLRRDVFAKVQDFSFTNIDTFSTGSLITRLTNDITQVQNLVNMGMRMMLRAPGMLIGALVMSIALSPSLSVILAVVIPALIVTLAFVIRTAFPRFSLMQKKIDGVNSAIQENLTNVRVVKSFVRGEFEEEKFGKANTELMENSLRAFRVIIATMPVMVLQDTHLFTGTVMENIRYGRLDATDDEVIAAAKTASAHSFIMRLSDGYQTMLQGDGVNLSQGQRQLLNIARAAVSKAPMLVLDEATSSVDTRTERHIEHGMDRLMKNRTTFVIAHRLSTVRNADEILVLEHGVIVERGTHEELLAQKGRYFELYTGKAELD